MPQSGMFNNIDHYIKQHKYSNTSALDVKMANRAQWSPNTDGSELMYNILVWLVPRVLITVTSPFWEISLISAEQLLLPQTLARKFQQSHRKCVNSFETGPDVYFM